MRCIHFIVALRLRFPDEPILISKYDLSDAYRRMAHEATAAVQTILVQGMIAYIFLRLSFGGSPNPPCWCGFSEMLCDLANEITLIKEWDPGKLHSPLQPTAPTPIYEDKSVPFAEARKLAVEVPRTSLGRGDCFIDDIVWVYLAQEEVIKRNTAAALLALHVSMRSIATDEPHPRKETLSMEKLIAEGIPKQ